MLEILGSHPFETDEQGQLKTRIGTLFPEHSILYTLPPAVHAWQRIGFIEYLNLRRREPNLPPLTAEEEERVAMHSVDLVFEPGSVLIRPDPERMDLVFAADELLQQIISKRQIRFLTVSNPRVLDAIRKRGEYWRLSAFPKTREAKSHLLRASKVGIHGAPIYYYNRITGTRWLTFHEFENLGLLPDDQLALHLQEIAYYSARSNRLERPELACFAVDLGRFEGREVAEAAYHQASPAQMRQHYEALKERFRRSVHEAFRRDDLNQKAWADRMLSTLFLEGNETQSEKAITGLSPEFFLQIDWLPGGRFEDGEFLFDSIFEEAPAHPEDAELQALCDLRTRGIIFNLIREHGDLEYINVGCVRESLSLLRPQTHGRRGVYIAEFQSASEPIPTRRVARLQKWGVWEHLDEGKDLLQSVRDSDEYTDYWLDRRLGGRQLGMNLSRRVVMRRLTEVYRGANPRYAGELIRTTYFEREFLSGTATDKLPPEKYAQPGYALQLASLLGTAAAASLIVGRSLEEGTKPVFDDGDELVCEGPDGLPKSILVADHSGAFGEYSSSLDYFAEHYARPVNNREHLVPDPKRFAETYLAALLEQFQHIQSDYRKRRRAFDTLFKHCKYDPAGSFAYRWERVLARLDQTDAAILITSIRRHVRVLNSPPPTSPLDRR